MTTEDELRAADIAAWNRDLKRAQDNYYSRCPRCRYRRPDCNSNCEGCRREDRL